MNLCRGRELVNRVINLVEKKTGLTAVREYLGRIIYLDAITLNNDRHLNNISFKLFKDSSWGYMPVYDNGSVRVTDIKKYQPIIFIIVKFQLIFLLLLILS